MRERFSGPDYGFDFDFEPLEPEGHAEGVSRLSVGFYADEEDDDGPPIWELVYSCGLSDHNYTIRYHLVDVDKVIETLVNWAHDEDLPLTSRDVGGIMGALVGLSDGADSGETAY